MTHRIQEDEELRGRVDVYIALGELRVAAHAVVAEAVADAKMAVEAQALEIKAFETMSSEVAQEAGKAAGLTEGEEAGGIAGEKVAVEAVLAKAVAAAEKLGVEIFVAGSCCDRG